jgi:O-antigen/teichoic acid export membrane protein
VEVLEMLKNRLRKIMGVVIVVVMLVAIVQYVRQASGSGYMWSALGSGMLLIGFLFLILWLVYRYDQRLKKSEE